MKNYLQVRHTKKMPKSVQNWCSSIQKKKKTCKKTATEPAFKGPRFINFRNCITQLWAIRANKLRDRSIRKPQIWNLELFFRNLISGPISRGSFFFLRANICHRRKTSNELWPQGSQIRQCPGENVQHCWNVCQRYYFSFFSFDADKKSISSLAAGFEAIDISSIPAAVRMKDS